MNFEIDTQDYLLPNYNYESITYIPVIDASKLSYNDFLEKFMLPNLPCIIKGITDNWEASQFWVKDSKPDFEYLSNKYGNSNVTVYNCSERFYNSQKTRNCSFNQYLNYWKRYCTADSGLALDYLKDWHLKLHNKNDNFYEVPIYFASDWLNEYYSECMNDDYRFVYMGPKGTWTPFHADVFTSYSWSANIYGKKKWLLFPPGEENYLKDALNNLPYDVTKVNHTRKFFEVIQNSGEAIFVPSGWHHQVWNLEDTVSVNHNWVNGCNIKMMWLSIRSNLELIRREIDDCKDMENFDEHCQIMLNASFGMDYYKFYDFIKFIGLSRMALFKNIKPGAMFHGHKIGQNHILFDLKAIQSILDLFIECEDINGLPNFENCVDMKPIELLEQLYRFWTLHDTIT